MGKVAEVFKAIVATITVGGMAAVIICWFGIIPLVATVFQGIFTGLQFLLIMAMMIALLIVVGKLVYNVDVK